MATADTTGASSAAKISDTSVEQTIRIRAAVNKWIADNLPEQRRHLSHTLPTAGSDGLWHIELLARRDKRSYPLGKLVVGEDQGVSLSKGTPESVAANLEMIVNHDRIHADAGASLCGDLYDFRFADGISGSAELDDRSVDLLLTDPPYSISNPYTCESQVPRRLRKNGTDFIMPKGHFGHWDYGFSPAEWTSLILPKVRGWAVIFCAQEQIGEYSEILRAQKFVAVGTLVWQKTNPVPFNHAYKPINAWEALVIGKRSGAKFNGHVVHNVFLYKSPSPQERIHSTQKPIGLIAEFIELFSNQGDFILDPFAGSATTVAAAIGLQRRVLAFENDPESFQAASKRIISKTSLLYEQR